MFTKVKEDRAERMEPGQLWVMTGRDHRETGKEELFSLLPPFLIYFICRAVLGSRQNPAENKVPICNNHPLLSVLSLSTVSVTYCQFWSETIE